MKAARIIDGSQAQAGAFSGARRLVAPGTVLRWHRRLVTQCRCLWAANYRFVTGQPWG